MFQVKSGADILLLEATSDACALGYNVHRAISKSPGGGYGGRR